MYCYSNNLHLQTVERLLLVGLGFHFVISFLFVDLVVALLLIIVVCVGMFIFFFEAVVFGCCGSSPLDVVAVIGWVCLLFVVVVVVVEVLLLLLLQRKVDVVYSFENYQTQAFLLVLILYLSIRYFSFTT